MLEIKLYDLFLDVNFQEKNYKGKLKIELETDEDVTLDSVGHKIISIKSQEKEISFKYENSKLTIQTGKFSGILEIDYEGEISNKLVGFYVAKYDNSYILTTQFEATHAREFLPCKDDPSYKAEFKLTVKVDKDLDVISNMNVERIEYSENKKIVYFAKTPKMSTYLLYLGIGKFEEISDSYKDKKIIVATPPNKISKGEFALKIAKNVLEYFENYFQIQYELPKLHLIVVPEFAFGAMENWGAITFRETALLADEKSSIRQKRNVALVITHEISHQWFGNLVTMKWWDDLWLNESFATYMAFKAIDRLFKEWNVMKDFLLTEYSNSMLRDSLTTTHPIEAKVEKPEEIEQLFDEISYGKGACILRMIEGFIGEEKFREGINFYLNRYKYSNASGEDLWECLEKVSNQPIRRIMKEWIVKEGYPIVYVNVEGNKINLKQERFMLNGYKKDVWPIPLTLEVNGKKLSMVFDKEEDTIEFPEEIHKLKLNLNKTGFYRVFYNNQELFLNSNPSNEDIFGFLNDLYAFLLTNKISFNNYEKIIRNYFNNYDYLIVYLISNQLFELFTINPYKYFNISKEYFENQIKYWENINDENGKMIYGMLCFRYALINEEFAKKIANLFEKYDEIDPNIKQAVATAYAISFEDDAYSILLERYKKEKFDEEKIRFLNALLSFRKSYLILNTLGLILTREVKMQESIRMISYLVNNPFIKEALWIWLKTYINKLREIYKGTGILGNALSYVIPFLPYSKIKEIEEFFSKNKIEEAEMGIKKGIELLKVYSKLS